MIVEMIDKLSKENAISYPEDFCRWMEQIQNDIYQFAFCEIKAGERCFVFNNFLGKTGKLNTDLYEWNRFVAAGADYIIFGNGVYGESFVLGVKASDVGKVYVSFEEDGDKKKILISDTFSGFLKKLLFEN